MAEREIGVTPLFFFCIVLFAGCSSEDVKFMVIKTDQTMTEILFDASSKVCAEPGDRWMGFCVYHRRKYV